MRSLVKDIEPRADVIPIPVGVATTSLVCVAVPIAEDKAIPDG